jgi:Ser/Thr protein kinase RdoA (MazF antagonist)
MKDIINKEYNLKINNIEEISKDIVWLVFSDSDKFILKRKKDLKIVKKEIFLLKHLEEKIFKQVSYPILNKNNNYYFIHEDKIYMIFSYINGEHIDLYKSNNKYFYTEQICEFLGKLHKSLEDIKSEILPSSNLLKTLNGYINSFIKENPQKINSEKVLKIINYLNENFPTLYEKLPRQFIHRDFHVENVIFFEEKVTGIIDFEIAVEEVKIFDIAYFNSSILSELLKNQNENEWVKYLKSSIKGYLEANTINDYEKEAFIYILLEIQMIFIVYFNSINDFKRLKETEKILFYIFGNKNTIIEIMKSV